MTGPARRIVLAFAVFMVLFATGCTYMTVPDPVPLLNNMPGSSLNGVSVLPVNAEQDASLSRIPTAEARDSVFKASRQAWSRKLIESLARELARRGATVGPGARVQLNISLPEIVFVETRDVYQFRVKASVLSFGGWSRNYTGVAGVNAQSVFSLEKDANRLAGLALANAIREMLRDEEFLRQLK